MEMLGDSQQKQTGLLRLGSRAKSGVNYTNIV